MTFAPSGQQFEISAGDQHATIVEVGGGIRSYRAGDRDVLQPYPPGQMCDGAHGAPLIPWQPIEQHPDRIVMAATLYLDAGTASSPTRDLHRRHPGTRSAPPRDRHRADDLPAERAPVR